MDGDPGSEPGTDPGRDAAADTVLDPTVPILERAPQPRYTCAETLPPTTPSPSDWGSGGLAVVDGRAWVLRLGQGSGLSPLGLDGAVGDLIDLGLSPNSAVASGMAVTGGHFSLVWSEQSADGTQVLRFAAVKDGAVVVTPRDVPGVDADWITGVATDAAPGGEVVVAWTHADASGLARVTFARLDAGGDVIAGPVDVGTNSPSYGGQGCAVARWGDGYALAWSLPGAGGAGDVWFATVDADGHGIVAPRRVSRPAGGGTSSRVAARRGSEPLLVTGDLAFLAFTESRYTNDGASPIGSTTVQLAVIDAQGQIVVHPLQGPVSHVTATDPTLFQLGDALGVTWSQGSFVYDCTHCFIDNDLKVALLDPAALVPVSPVATHAHDDHGYAFEASAVLGSNVLTVASQDFHALSLPAVAVMRCE
jgi:hypothetical protein